MNLYWGGKQYTKLLLAGKWYRMYISLGSVFLTLKSIPDYEYQNKGFIRHTDKYVYLLMTATFNLLPWQDNLKTESNYTYLVIAGVVTPLVRKVDFPRTTGTSAFSEPPFK